MSDDAPALRAADADRERTAALLRDHTAEGRLTVEELGERLTQVYGARTLEELRALVADLPDVSRPLHVRPPRRFGISLLGDSRVDLRSSALPDDVTVTAVAVLGDTEVLVPPGVNVELVGLAVLGDRADERADVVHVPGAPTIRVRAFAFLGDVTIRSEPARRGLGLPKLPGLPR